MHGRLELPYKSDNDNKCSMFYHLRQIMQTKFRRFQLMNKKEKKNPKQNKPNQTPNKNKPNHIKHKN